jgi:hypothetical protein
MLHLQTSNQSPLTFQSGILFSAAAEIAEVVAGDDEDAATSRNSRLSILGLCV